MPEYDSMSPPHNSGINPPIVEPTKIPIQTADRIGETHFSRIDAGLGGLAWAGATHPEQGGLSRIKRDESNEVAASQAKPASRSREKQNVTVMPA